MCGERKLASLAENQHGRHLLDDEWADGAVNYALQAGQWKFAKRTVEIASSTSVTPPFGYQKAFDIPSDLLRTTALCSDPYQQVPLTQYSVEQAYWFADVEPLYVTYVSNDASYGGDMSLWPVEFVLFLQAYLASKIIETLTQDEKKWARVSELAEKYRKEAASSDAMEGPTVFPPAGSWVSARAGRGGPRDRGSRGQLTG